MNFSRSAIRKAINQNETAAKKLLALIERICHSKVPSDCKIQAINLLSWPGWEAGIDEKTMKILESRQKNTWQKLYTLFERYVKDSMRLMKTYKE